MILKNKSGRFTDKGVKALRHEVERYEVWEAHQTGLGLRVSALPNKHKSWQFTYSFVGKKRRLTLGRFPAESVEKANSKLLDAKRLLDDGIDPGKKKKAEKKADREAKTVRDLSDKFLGKMREKKRRTVDEYERVLEKDVLPELGAQIPRAVTRADIADLLDKIVERGSPIAANRTLAITRRLFNFGLSRGALESNPAAYTELPGEEAERSRVLNASEIKAFWRGLDQATMHESIKLGLRLQLATGTRIGEVAGARHESFNIAEKIWVVPASQSKNKKDNRLPLSPLALSIYEEMKALSDGSPWLMPSPHSTSVPPDKQQPIATRSIAHALKDNLDKIGVANIRTHDLRRTCSSGLASLGVTKNIRERVLNHTMDKLDRSYDQHFYDDEKRAALEQWGARIETILASDTGNVAALTREVA